MDMFLIIVGYQNLSSELKIKMYILVSKTNVMHLTSGLFLFQLTHHIC